MNHRRRHDERRQQESSFLRNWKFETPKEMLGKLVEWAGGAVGLVAGTAAAKRGIPLPPTVVSGTGAFLGMALGAVAKAALNAGFDTLKSRTARPDPAQTSITDGQSLPQQPVRLDPAIATRSTARGRAWSRRRIRGIGGARQDVNSGRIIAEVEQIISMIERAHGDLTGVIDGIRGNHAWLITLLTGASPARLQRFDGQSSGARRTLEEACTLLRLSRDSLRSYLRAI